MNNEIERNIEVEGESYKVTATPQEISSQENNYNYQYNMGRDNYTFANRPTRGKVRTLRRFDAVGRKDAGFTQVAILSVVICIALLVIAYFAFRF